MSGAAMLRQQQKGEKQVINVGDKVFYVHPKLGWQIGKVTADGGSKVTIEDASNGESGNYPPDQVHKYMEGAFDPRNPDLFGMGDLHPSTLLYCLKQRYEKEGMMFTRMGEIVISINPFEKKEYNDQKNMAVHCDGNWAHPHSWEVAHKAYKGIVVQDRGNQSILISGESGAGKTETAKTLIDYLGQMSYKHSCNEMQRSVAEQVNKKLKASNPILESFGNAKTSRNDNSSRFGKYIKLFFDKTSGVLTGAEMVHYLLEKSRIVGQNEGERGYHVFYEFLAGASPDMKAKYGGLKTPQDYVCLNKGGVFTRNSASGGKCDDVKEFQNLLQAMRDTGITEQEQDAIFSVLAAILHLQNITFDTDPGTGKAKISNVAGMDTVAKLLGVDSATLQKCLLVKAETKIMTQMADKAEAEDMRDALSKALYSGMFDWLVQKLNSAIRPPSLDTKQVKYIGLLDIFGFENFKKNSFEQFCINFTNESLQNHYNKYTFVQDAQECEAEGIACPIVEYPDNQPCLDMLEKEGGVMANLDAECSFKLGTDEGFTQKTWSACGNNPFFVKPKSTVATHFGIRHYAAEVTYTTTSWLEKNSDTLKDDMRQLIASSSEPSGFVKQLLDAPGDLAAGRKRPTVSSKFRKQLEELKSELNATDSHFIRTIKPNPEAQPRRVDNAYVMTQLSCAGVIETIIMKRQGYPVRQEHHAFWARYRMIAPKDVKKRFPYPKNPPKEELVKTCREVAELWGKVLPCPKPNFDIGHTKVFSKAKFHEGMELVRHRKIRRLLPKCIPYLRRWAQDFKQRKAEMERKRLAAQADINRSHTTIQDAEKAAKGSGMDAAKEKWFKDLVQLFPHFDLPVILNVVENCRELKTAQDFLLDMQRQRVEDALPTTVKDIFKDAQLRESTQEDLIRKGFTTREKLFGLTSEQMEKLGFNQDERNRLATVLLKQQSNWIVQQRLNLLMGAETMSAADIQTGKANLDFAAMMVKKDLEAQKKGGMDATVQGRAGSGASSGYSSSSRGTAPPPPAPVPIQQAVPVNPLPVMMCVVCGRSDRQMEKRDSGYKCLECKGKKHNKSIAAEQQRFQHPVVGMKLSSPQPQQPPPPAGYMKKSPGSSGGYSKGPPAASASPTVGVAGGQDAEKVQKLMNMGFTPDQATKALQKHKGDIKAAANAILNNEI